MANRGGSALTISPIRDNPADLGAGTWLDRFQQMQKSQSTTSSPPSFLVLPSIRGLIEVTDLHIALFIVANGNTAVKQLSKVTI